MDAYKKNGHPRVLSMASVGSEDNPSIALIKDEIRREKQYWTDYSSLSELKSIFETTLNWALIDIYTAK